MNQWRSCGLCALLIYGLAIIPAAADEQHMQIVDQQLDVVERDLQTGRLPQPPPAPPSVVPVAEKRPQQSTFHRFYATAAWDINHVHYSEWDGLDKLDEDMGTQRGMYYAAGYRSPNAINFNDWIIGKPFIEGYYYKPFANNIRYKGALIGGGPYNTTQKSTVDQMGVKLGGYNTFLGKGEIYGYVDGGKRVWNRGQNVLPQYHEKYYWVYTGFGGGFKYPILKKLSVGLDGELLFAINPRMYADILEYTFKLGSVWGALVKAPIKFYLSSNMSLDLTPYFTYWKINASNVSPDGYYEPTSKTHEEGLLSGMTLYY
ncbi:MAG: hypothetical protein KGK03_07645 [Candidatus Omnitrophica bacterium]|nr:hypothetical protein [Candidatus Omnitrophota bacterium]MDE2222929.1 hypothetical protein [Candidatus Omnitrophota bacterium]